MEELTPDQRLDLPCFVCKKPLENATRTQDGIAFNQNQPSEGLAFRSHGAYGGTVFDPMDGHYLEVNICDLCLLKGIGSQDIAIGKDWRNIRNKDRPNEIIDNERIPYDEVKPLRLWEGIDDPERDDSESIYR